MSNRTRQRPNPRSRPEPEAKRLPIWVPLGIIAVVALVVVIGVVAASQSDDEGDSLAFGQVEYIGDPLPPRPQAGADPAVGMTAPVLRGFSPDSVQLRFDNGAPRAIAYLAHWCGACQAELDGLNAWLAAGNSLPEGVAVQAVATWTDRARPNFPPGEWLADNDWDHPTIVDDEDTTLANLSGLSGTPMWIFVGADGTIVNRSGSLPPDQLAAQMQALLGSDGGGDGSDPG